MFRFVRRWPATTLMRDVERFRRLAKRETMNTQRRIQTLLLVVLALAAAWPARAGQEQTKEQKRAEAQLRVLHGSVIDKDENPVASSVVYLKNVKSQAVKTYIADDSGNYRFSGLDPNIDYEIHAEHADLTSPVRTISSFDSRRDIEVTLKLSRKKAAN
jgi:protocatechuate 3,4-dioxygenase beta subunit